MGRHIPGNDAAHKLRAHQAGQYGGDDNAELEKDIAPREAFQKLFKENDKEIYLEMFGNDPILLGKKMAEITLDKIKE